MQMPSKHSQFVYLLCVIYFLKESRIEIKFILFYMYILSENKIKFNLVTELENR
ncbi:hypothetical protein NEPAR06_0893 [Nematocida parisii]|uniref:Uncharacterized protein n=1 Tax=Nematocida parisii (strain ERTm3) TaxID=935791 RepID=I3EDS4_NEMP3|nr:hypothetical protein NEQG_02494 [Nematocida parisii ERTm3]KAI5127542.1 hypothetical protein NEPAR08_0912 [Nematocida parisii]KAI5127817.1 hypothetical protein NEPAR03_1097 [Nematocida parisii]KAI5141613.1 hypothetical protein NEPAR04_1090 [Nematocida parisii]KAI5145606.1 hypothetical protein NEPAR07_1806 [Nematocida parisii]